MKLRALILAILGGSLLALGCGQNPIPKLPTLTAAGDTQVRAAIVKVDRILGAMGHVLDEASQLEQLVDAQLPPDQAKAIRAQFVTVAKTGRQIVVDIDAGGLKDWAAIQARVNPLIDDINALSALTHPTGPSGWASLVEAIVQIAIAIVQPGAFGGGLDLSSIPAAEPLVHSHFTEWAAMRWMTARGMDLDDEKDVIVALHRAGGVR